MRSDSEYLAPRRRQGFTIMELTLSVAVLSVVTVSVGQLFLSFSTTVSQQVREAHLGSRSQVVMDRLLSELVTGEFVTMDPPIPDTSNWIRFQRPVDFVSGSIVYGKPIQIDLVPNGDSAQLRIWEDHGSIDTSPGPEDDVVIIAANVSPGGLVFNRFGSILEVNLTMFDQIDDTGPPTMVTIVSGVRMRNSE